MKNGMMECFDVVYSLYPIFQYSKIPKENKIENKR